MSIALAFMPGINERKRIQGAIGWSKKAVMFFAPQIVALFGVIRLAVFSRDEQNHPSHRDKLSGLPGYPGRMTSPALRFGEQSPPFGPHWSSSARSLHRPFPQMGKQ